MNLLTRRLFLLVLTLLSGGIEKAIAAPFSLVITPAHPSFDDDGEWNFGEVIVGTTTAPVVFTVTNTGTAALTITSTPHSSQV